MKSIATLCFAAVMLCGCVAGGSAIPHADSPAVANTDAGPELCRDGTAPPCNDRD